MGYFVQIKRLFDKRLLFIFLAIFSFQFVFSFPNIGRTCEVDNHLNIIPETCICNYIGDDGLNHRFDCDCYDKMQKGELCKCQYKDSCSSLTSSEQCFPCFQYDGGGCYESFASACSSHGFEPDGSIGGHCFKRRYENGKVVENIIGGLVTFSYLGFNTNTTPNPFQCNWSNSGSGSGTGSGDTGSGSGTGTNSGGGDNSSSDPPQADQKKVCSGGECKCYNLTTGKEEPCIGGNNSGGGSNSSGDNGSGSGNTGTGTGNGSVDSGNGQGSGSESSPSAGSDTNSGSGGDNSGTGTGSNNGNNSGGGTHTGSSGNQHGGGGTGLGGGSSGSNNGSPNGSDNGKEDGSEDGDDYCLKNPKSVVCKGEPKQGDFDDIVIPTKEVNDSWVKDMFLPDNGTCPAPLKANFLGKTISISYEPLCKLLVQVRFAVLLLFAYISARLGLGGKL